MSCAASTSSTPRLKTNLKAGSAISISIDVEEARHKAYMAERRRLVDEKLKEITGQSADDAKQKKLIERAQLKRERKQAKLTGFYSDDYVERWLKEREKDSEIKPSSKRINADRFLSNTPGYKKLSKIDIELLNIFRSQPKDYQRRMIALAKERISWKKLEENDGIKSGYDLFEPYRIEEIFYGANKYSVFIPLKKYLGGLIQVLKEYTDNKYLEKITWTEKEIRLEAALRAKSFNKTLSKIEKIHRITARTIVKTKLDNARVIFDSYFPISTDFQCDEDDDIFISLGILPAYMIRMKDHDLLIEQEVARLNNNPDDNDLADIKRELDEHYSKIKETLISTKRGWKIANGELDPYGRKTLYNNGITKRLKTEKFHRYELRRGIDQCDAHITAIAGLLNGKHKFVSDNALARLDERVEYTLRMLDEKVLATKLEDGLFAATHGLRLA